MRVLCTTKKYHQRGLAILFAILISSIILMIGAGVFSISLKETLLTSTARESQYAFYAADAGAECALFYDANGDFASGGSPNVNCNNTAIVTTGGYPKFEFRFPVDSINNSCALVSVDKEFTIDGELYTRIVATGYSICNASAEPNADDPTLTQRVLQVTYRNP